MRSTLIILLIALVILGAFVPTQISPGKALPNPQTQPTLYFNSPKPVWQSIRPDLAPAALVTSDGTIWVAWASNRSGAFQIYLRTFNGISWSTIQSLSSLGFNTTPSLALLSNGTIILLWAGGTNGYDDHLYYRAFTNGVWSGQTQLTSSTTFTDESPKMVVTQDSTLWLFFERDNSTGPSTPPTRQIYYKTLVGNVWSPDTQSMVDNAADTSPDVTMLKDGSLWLVWARTPSTGGTTTLFYKTLNKGSWSNEIALSSAANSDNQPNLIQDRNGTIWLFWARSVQIGTTGIFQSQIFYKISYDVGATWSGDILMTNWGSSTAPIDNLTPFAVQGPDTSVWMFFATNLVSVYDFDIYYMTSSSIYPVHSATVSSIQVSGTICYYRGLCGIYPYGYNAPSQEIATIGVTVANTGDFDETLTLTLQAMNNTNSIARTSTQTIPIKASLSTVLTFSWNISGVFPAKYTVIATIAALPGETQGNVLGNSRSYYSFNIFYAGDSNHDGVVNIGDFVVCGHSYGYSVGSPNYIPDCDLNRNGRGDTPDFILMGHNYQKRIS